MNDAYSERLAASIRVGYSSRAWSRSARSSSVFLKATRKSSSWFSRSCLSLRFLSVSRAAPRGPLYLLTQSVAVCEGGGKIRENRLQFLVRAENLAEQVEENDFRELPALSLTLRHAFLGLVDDHRKLVD
jgi:hypothetical protein